MCLLCRKAKVLCLIFESPYPEDINIVSCPISNKPDTTKTTKLTEGSTLGCRGQKHHAPQSLHAFGFAKDSSISILFAKSPVNLYPGPKKCFYTVSMCK